MKKILYAVTKSNFGGAQKYVFELAEEARKKGHAVSVVCGGNGALVDRLEQIAVPVFSLSSASRDINLIKEIKTLFSLYKITRKFNPDTVHLNSPKLGGLGAVVARIAGVKNIIYTNHGWPFMEDRPIWQRLIIKFFSWLTVLFCHKIIVLSNREYNMVKNWIGSKGKIVLIRNGIKPFNVLEKEDALIAILGQEPALNLIKNNTRIVGNIGELTKNKGYTYALQGFKQYKDFAGHTFNTHYIIVSDGEEKEKIIHQIKNLGLESDVTLAGYIKDAGEFIKAFDLFMLSSVKEGLPYVILEAGLAGVPVISTDVGGIAEIIKNKETGFLIQPARPQEIKHILTYIDEHSGESRIYAENLKKKIVDEMDFETLSQKVFALY